MNLKPALDKISLFSTQTYEFGKNTVALAGVHIKAGFSQYIVPAAQKIQSIALDTFKNLGNFLKRGPGPVFGIAAGLFVIGIAAFTCADRKSIEADGFAKGAWKALGVASFIFATAATAAGIVTLLRV